MAEWSNELTFEFLERLAAEPALYDPKNPDFKSRNTCYKALSRIQQCLSVPMEMTELKKRKDSLWSSFRYHLRRKKEMTMNGSREPYQPSWSFYDFMYGFLGQIYDNENSKIVEDSEPVIEFVGFDVFDDILSSPDSPQTPQELKTQDAQPELTALISGMLSEKREFKSLKGMPKTAPKRKRSSLPKKQSPTQEKQLPSQEKQHPSHEKQHPSHEKQLPSHEKQLPSHEKQLPSHEKQLPFQENRFPFQKNQFPFQENHLPFQENQFPFQKNQFPFQEKQLPFQVNQAPSQVKQSPFQEKQLPFQEKQPPLDQCSILSSNDDDDDCDLYGKLLAKKLRKLPEFQKERLMYEIQGLFVRASHFKLTS